MNVEWVIRIYTDNPQYQEMPKEIKGMPLEINELLIAEYSKQELDSSEFLVLNPKFESNMSSVDDPTAFFDMLCPD